MRSSDLRSRGLFENFMYQEEGYPNMLERDRNNNAKMDFRLMFGYRVYVSHAARFLSRKEEALYLRPSMQDVKIRKFWISCCVMLS